VAAAGGTVLLALTSDHIPEPGVHAALQVWGLLGFVFAGVVAWWRRPESRFGVLMVAAGGVWFLSSLSSANLAVPFTLGIVFDLVPAVVFLHVFLAFPSGRLEHRSERALLAVGYFTALGVQLAAMTLGGFGPDNLLELASEPGTSQLVQRAQLSVPGWGRHPRGAETRRGPTAAAFAWPACRHLRRRARDGGVPLPFCSIRHGQR
jgi:hypothetical protein